MSRAFLLASIMSLLIVFSSLFTPPASADWKAEWEKVLAAAKKEGKVAVAGPPGPSYREVMRGFERKYPEIALEYQGHTPRSFTARFFKEREAEQYLWDIYITGPTSFDVKAKKAGDLLPVRPAMLLPEVSDESVWFGGFNKAFLDSEKQFVFAFQTELSPQVYVNREFIPESDLNTIEGLLNPKWKGKIVMSDPRVDGAGNGRVAFWLGAMGEEFVLALLKVDLALSRDDRQMADWLARGRYPIAIGAGDTEVRDLQKLGIGQKIEALGAVTHRPAWRLSTAWGSIRLISKPPHPNAAKVFLNWLLSKDGQTEWATKAHRPSRRLDVPKLAGKSPVPGIDYFDIDHEETIALRDKAKEIAIKILR